MKLFQKRIILLLMIIIFISSCQKNKLEDNNFVEFLPKEYEELTPEVISILSDSFMVISSCDLYDNYIALLDSSLNKCYVYKNYELISVFGEKGQAPGKFNFVFSGIIKFNEKSEINIYDILNSRVQIFSTEGNLLKTVKIIYISSDFDIDEDYMFLSPGYGCGENELVILDNKTGELMYEFNSLKIIDITKIDEMEIPPPIRMLETGSNGEVYLITNDQYIISLYKSKEDSVKFIFSVKTEPIPYHNEIIEEVLEEYPEFKDRLRKYQFPCFGLFMDKVENILWVWVSSENEEEILFDLFNIEGIYLKRVKINIDICTPLAINNGRMAVFNHEDMFNPMVIIYDVSPAY